MRTVVLISVVSCAALAAAPATAQKISDVVVKKDGGKVRGVEITELRLDGVRGTRGTEAFQLPAHQVAAIEWSDLPEAFVAGRAAMDRGDFRTATTLFAEVKSARPLVKADAEFFALAAAVAAIDNDERAAATAAANAKKWLAGHTDHWRTPEVLLLAGRAERLAGACAAAAATLRALEDRAAREGFGAVWIARARAELAAALLADGKPGEARAAFQAASAAADSALGKPSPDDAELKALTTLARVGEGEMFLAEKDWAKAESYFRSLAAGGQPELVAAGHAGAGQAIFLAAVAGNRPGDLAGELRRAQLELATASVTDGQSDEAAAKANYYLGRCLLALGQEREGDTFRQRANSYFQIVASSYPASRWAGPAKAELSR